MEFKGEQVVIDRPPNDLDRLILDVSATLDAVGVEHAVVSGYVAVLFGRSRATEDIDVIAERFDNSMAEELAERLHERGFWGPDVPLDGMHETLADDPPIRVAEQDHRVPNVELKFATDEYDRASLHEAITVRLRDGEIRVGSLELQIAYKLRMGAQRDFEDALYLYEVVGPNLDTSSLETYVEMLGVESEYERLRES